MSSPLITAAQLQALLADGALPALVLDAGFDLSNPEAGRMAHAAAHVPGAVYLHLDDDLSAAKTGRNGRHPLPTREAFAQRMAALGARHEQALVVYDNSGGMYAARAWWMLRWLGHADVRLLDGGLAAWRAAGGALESGPVAPRAAGAMPLRPALVATIDLTTLRAGLGQTGAPLIVDARGADRYRGENETLDPKAGHIPGAVNRCFRDNMDSSGLFKPAAKLRAEWQALIGDRAAATVVQQCGSGVTACHNLVALEQAGLAGSLLYAGSWSEWSAQPDAPIALGAEP